MKNRMKRPSLSTVLASALLLVVTACSTTGTANSDTMMDAAPVLIAVENSLVPGTTVTVEAHALGSNSEQVLGTVEPLEAEEFRYEPTGLRTEDFRLTATTTRGDEIVSPPFTLAGASAVTWDLNTNEIDVGGS